MPDGIRPVPTSSPSPGGAITPGRRTALWYAWFALIRVPDAVVRYGLLSIVVIYQLTLSYVLGNQCRFYPTCSEYALEALVQKPSWRGIPVLLWRILRCQPLCKGGVDELVIRPADAPYRLPWKWRRKTRSCICG